MMEHQLRCCCSSIAVKLLTATVVGMNSVEHQAVRVNVMDGDDVYASLLVRFQPCLDVTINRLSGKRCFQCKGYLTCLWNHSLELQENRKNLKFYQ